MDARSSNSDLAAFNQETARPLSRFPKAAKSREFAGDAKTPGIRPVFAVIPRSRYQFSGYHGMYDAPKRSRLQSLLHGRPFLRQASPAQPFEDALAYVSCERHVLSDPS